MESIPRALRETLDKVRERALTLAKQYRSLSNYGRPIFEDIRETAVIYYLNEKLNIGLNVIADYIGVDKTSVYNLVKRIKEKGIISITNPATKRVESVSVSPSDLINIVESEILSISSKTKIKDPQQSAVIKDFMTKNIERLANRDRRTYYTDKEKRQTLRAIEYLMDLAEKEGLPTNPDFWDKETLLKLLDNITDLRKKRNIVKLLRRIPAWRNWLEGYVGAEKKYITPKLSVLFYKDYLKLKDLMLKKEISENDFLIIWLHIVTGAREGWKSEATTDTSLESVNTSLIGLKWENLEKVGDSWILKIYEHKTRKWWSCDISWLDPDIVPIFLRYRKDKGSIISTLSNCKTVKEFEKYYRKLLKDISEKLGLEFTLVPHDLRRSHISILAELGVPLEIAVSGLMDFGVGWEDLSTALVFYTRFSRHKKEMLLKELRERQKTYF
ncbi:MAG: hypothetical protein QXW41_08025 [Fervidicoccaceae archaeon]